MTLDKALRNTLRNTVTRCRRLLEDAVGDVLEGRLGIGRDGQVEDAGRMGHLSESEMEHREEVISHLRHIEAGGFKPADAVAQLIREVAYTHLNRLCAYKMLERRKLVREAVGRGLDSNGFKFYLVDHPEDEKLWTSGQQDVAYRHFLEWLGGTLSEEIGVLFSPTDPANRLFPPQRTLDAVLALINSEELNEVWDEEETIGWVYQYYTPKELRDQARKESQAPRNSYELSFRNQFYTPRYVVQFLVDNTLGRTWYEMRQGNTCLTEQCDYLVRRPDEVFLSASVSADSGFTDRGSATMVRLLQEGDEGSLREFGAGENLTERLMMLAQCVDGYKRHSTEQRLDGDWWPWAMKSRMEGADDLSGFSTQDLMDVLFFLQRRDYWTGGLEPIEHEVITIPIANEVRQRVLRSRGPDLSQGERLRAPVFVPYRALKDPRELKVLDPACGSGHFLLYCFDLLEAIYEETYDDERIGEGLREEYPDRAEFRRAVPALILRHNLHGIDIDVRATQIAALALWLRAQRAYVDLGLRGRARPRITRSNIVCAEPMPGEREMLEEFTRSLDPPVLGQLVEVVFDKMRLAGEAGSLLKIEDEIEGAIARARAQWQREFERAMDRRGNELLLTHSEIDALSNRAETQLGLFDVSEITDEEFWAQAEGLVIEALSAYSNEASNGDNYQRKLFADDATQGFAFLDICRKRYDVVLMNPPFGLATQPVFRELEESSPATYVEIYASFVRRGLRLLSSNGLVGAITSRGFLTTSRLAAWRRSDVIPHITLLLDLGLDVMDEAFVESCAYVLQERPRDASLHTLDIRREPQRESNAMATYWHTPEAVQDTRMFLTQKTVFSKLPDNKLLYRLPHRLFELITENSGFEPAGGLVRTGLTTFDDFRFLRLSWEVPVKGIGRGIHWEYFSKGGEYAKYHSDVHLLINRKNDGAELAEVNLLAHGQTAQSRQGSTFYYLPGLTFTGRSAKGFTARALPADCVISHNAPSVYPSGGTPLHYLLGWINSRLIRTIVQLHANAAYYAPGTVKPSPWIPPDMATQNSVAKNTQHLLSYYRHSHSFNEVSPDFCICDLPWQSIEAKSQVLKSELERTRESVHNLQSAVSDSIDGLYSVNTNTVATDVLGLDADQDIPLNDITSGDIASQLVSLTVGAIYGRWDMRIALDSSLAPQLADPLARLPACSPGMLVGSEGLPAKRNLIASEEWLRARPDAITSPPEGSVEIPTIHDSEYPLSVDWDGILVDDRDHPDDIVSRVRAVLQLVWGERADCIEGEVCDILSVKDLQTYFRNPKQFFEHHIKRYSKSRRKAPIYWLLQSPKGNYGLWLYYHRLDPDMLFKALTKYVEPKIRLEEGRLEEYEARRRSAGTGGREAKQAEKDLAKQEELLTDLREFRDRLERAAKLHLRPDLNDGVVLNIAPLHELVPWKEAKSRWNELLAGKYEWSSIGKQLREKGLV